MPTTRNWSCLFQAKEVVHLVNLAMPLKRLAAHGRQLGRNTTRADTTSARARIRQCYGRS